MDWAALISVVCEDLANVGIFLVGIAAAYAFKKNLRCRLLWAFVGVCRFLTMRRRRFCAA
jgi:hypothetical protein